MTAARPARKPTRFKRVPDAQAHGDLFHDGKDPAALRTIGEVAIALGLRQHVLRYWEEQFPMLRPMTRAGGRRYYRPVDIALLIKIDRLIHRDGYTIRGARLALGDPAPPSAEREAQEFGDAASSGFEQAIFPAIDSLRLHLTAIRDRLVSALIE